MKKFTTLLLALVFAVAVFTGCGGKSTTTSSESSSGDSKSELLSKSYVDIMKSGKYFMHYKATVTADGQSMEADCTMAIDGEKISSSTVTNGVKAHMIIKDKELYMINDTDKTFFKFPVPEDNNSNPNVQNAEKDKIDMDGVTYVGKGKDTFKGKEYNYEEYKTNDGTIRYYFDGNKLHAMVVKTGNDEMIMEILELSNKVDASTFEVPSGYTEVKMGM